jgi:hypothetical protein
MSITGPPRTVRTCQRSAEPPRSRAFPVPCRTISIRIRSPRTVVVMAVAREELLGLVRADAEVVSWMLDCTTTVTPDGVDVKGPYVQGRPGARFIYLSWVTVDHGAEPTLFRRAKLWLDGVPPVSSMPPSRTVCWWGDWVSPTPREPRYARAAGSGAAPRPSRRHVVGNR